jgi:hypothetical protein
VELEENDKTPQYQQAKKVAELNKQRNDGPVHALRNEWGRFQGFARTKRQVEEHPDDAKAAENLKKIEEQMQGMEERVQKAEAEAKVIEDQIFQANQPAPHKYELRAVGGGDKRAANNRAAASVNGVVTLDGRPLADAEVRFVDRNGKAVSGTTDDKGSFTLKDGGKQRVPAGNYRVVISAKDVPAKYSDGEGSVLQAQIEQGANVFNFDLRQK